MRLGLFCLAFLTGCAGGDGGSSAATTNDVAGCDGGFAPCSTGVGTTTATSATSGTTGGTTGSTATTTTSGSGTGSTTAVTTGTPDGPYAHFELFGDDYNDVYDWSDAAGNLIFCRDFGGSDVWIRFAQEPAADGENSPHIDIDLCNYSGAGSYTPFDPWAGSCPAGQAWDIWWHDGPTITYTNDPVANPCGLELVVNGNAVEGTFTCDPMLEAQGTKTLAANAGAFRCTIVPG